MHTVEAAGAGRLVGHLTLAGSRWLSLNRRTHSGLYFKRLHWPAVEAGIAGRKLERLEKLGCSNRGDAFLFPDVPEEP